MKCVQYLERDSVGRVIGSGWCAVKDDSDIDNVKTKCGYFVWCAGAIKSRKPTCDACRRPDRGR